MIWLIPIVYGVGALYTYQKNQSQSSVPKVNAEAAARLKADPKWQSEIVRRSLTWPLALLPSISPK
jgi:hypothetical protein